MLNFVLGIGTGIGLEFCDAFASYTWMTMGSSSFCSGCLSLVIVALILASFCSSEFSFLLCISLAAASEKSFRSCSFLFAWPMLTLLYGATDSDCDSNSNWCSGNAG